MTVPAHAKDSMARALGQNVKPSRALEEKKARFFVSSGLSLVHSGDRGCGSDSPVNELLSTWILIMYSQHWFVITFRLNF